MLSFQIKDMEFTESSLRSRLFPGEDLRAGKLGRENCARAEKRGFIGKIVMMLPVS